METEPQPMSTDQDESDAEAAAPPEDARPKRPRRRRATMKTLVDDVHKYLCFGGANGLGVQAVQRMMQNAEATAAEGTRGDKFVLDENTCTYSLMNVIPTSSSPDTVSLRYLKQGDDHSAPVLTDMCINALLTVPEIDAATKASKEIRFVPLLRSDELKVRDDDLAFAKKLAAAPNADVADLFYRDEPLTDKAPYNNNSGRIKYHSERKPLVHRKVVEENSDALFVIVDYSVVSGGKGAAAEAALLDEPINGLKIVRLAVASCASSRSKMSPTTLLKPEIYKVVADAAKKSLEGDGVALQEGARGGGLYTQNLTPDGWEGIQTWYGGSHLTGKASYKVHAQGLAEAVEEKDASEAQAKANNLLRARWVRHQSDARSGKHAAKYQSCWQACDAAIDDDFHVPDVSECIVYTRSSAGETEAQYRRRLIALEQGLLDVLFEMERGKLVQLANTDELALGCIKPKKVKDVDGILKYAHLTIAALQKRAETFAQKKDAALLDDAADRVAAALDVDESAAADALLIACDAVLRANAAQKPALRIVRTDAERVLKGTCRVRDAPEGRRADIEKLLLEAAKAVVEADEPKLISARAYYEQLESSLRPRVPRKTAEAKDLERLQRATDALPKVQDDLKAKVAVLEFHLAAKDVVDAIDSDAKIALRIKCDARERAAMRACPADLLFRAAMQKQQEEAEREQKDDECLEAAKRRWRVAKAANNTAAVAAAREAWRASKDVIAAKPEEKKQLRSERDKREGEAQAALSGQQRVVAMTAKQNAEKSHKPLLDSMATSIEALRRDGYRIGDELIIDAAVESLRQAAADVLSEKAGAIRPDEVPAPAPAPPAPDEAAMPVAEAVPPRPPAVAPMEDEEYQSHGMALDRPALLPPPPAVAPMEDEEYQSHGMALDRPALLPPPPAETPAAAPAADEVGSDAVGAVGVPAAAPAPAPATALAALEVQVDEAYAANSPFSKLLLEVAQVVRLVEGERDGTFSDAEWILITSLVDYFRNGMLPLKAGSSLRLFLATLLNRDPMAITKKFIAEEMELGKQTFKRQDVDLAKPVRTFRDQVAEFVASQQDRPYHGVSEEKGRRKNPWRASIHFPKSFGSKRAKFLGNFPTKKAAACAHDAFIEDDYRFDEAYVRKNSNRINHPKDFATMNEEMKAAAEVGRSKATKEAPAPAPAAPGGTAPSAAAKPRAKQAKRARSPSRPARASEDARRAAMGPPTAVVAPPGQAAAAEPLTEGQQHIARYVSAIDLSSNRALVLLLLRVAEATHSGRSRKDIDWTDIESDLAEALFAQFGHSTLPLEARASLRSFLAEVLNCDRVRITKKFQQRVKKKHFEPRDGVDLDDVARRLEPLAEPFIKSLQGRPRSVSPWTTTAPAPPPPPLPEGVPQPPANAVRPVAAPAPAAAAPGNEMDVTE